MPVVIGVLWVRSARWRALVTPIKPVSGGRIFSIYSVAQLANILLPAGTGHAVRMILLNRTEGVTKTGVISTMMLETLLDGLSLLLFMMGASAALVLPEWLQRGERWASIIILAAFALFIVAVHYRHRIAAGVKHLEHRLPEPIYNRIDRLWTNFSEGLSALRSLKHVTAAFFLSVASWVGNLAVISMLLYAFGISLPTGAALVLMVINAMLMIVPITPGNIGTYQVACVVGLTIFDVPKTDAVSYGLILQIVSILPILTVGSYQYFRHSWSLKETAREAGIEQFDDTPA